MVPLVFLDFADFCGILRIFTDFCGILRMFAELLRNFAECCGIVADVCGFLRNFAECLRNFAEFCGQTLRAPGPKVTSVRLWYLAKRGGLGSAAGSPGTRTPPTSRPSAGPRGPALRRAGAGVCRRLPSPPRREGPEALAFAAPAV